MSGPSRPTGHAFISYVSEDSGRVDQLQQTLEASGIRVWRDTADLWPGEDWRAQIRRAITDGALAFIACFSRAGQGRSRSYQNEEIQLAIDQLRLRSPDVPWLIPVRLDDCIVPDFDIGGGRTLASIHCADLFGNDASLASERLVAAVLRVLASNSGNASRPGPGSAAAAGSAYSAPNAAVPAARVRPSGTPGAAGGPADRALFSVGGKLKTLYLTVHASAYNHEAFLGRNLAEQFRQGGSVLVRHWLCGSRKSEIERFPAIVADATDHNEFYAFAPDVIFLEGGLYWNGRDWRIPQDLTLEFIDAGGVLIVADVDQNELSQSFESYQGDLPFFGARLAGYPAARSGIRYVRDSHSNHEGYWSSILCPHPKEPLKWTRDTRDGVESVLAALPVALDPEGDVLLWSAPTADVLCGDRYLDQGLKTPLATVRRHGLGYAVIIAANVSSDAITDDNPANLRWLLNIANVLHERAIAERRLREGVP